MALESKPLKLAIKLPQNFTHILDDWMDDNLNTASLKWSISLTSEQTEKIKENTLVQLENKVSLLAGEQWKTTDKTLAILLENSEPNSPNEIKLPLSSKNPKKYNIIRTRNNWQIDFEGNNQAIPLHEFYDYLMIELQKWTETAIFYGTASYAGER